MADENATLGALRSVAEGLLFTSESDAPLEVFHWPGGSAGEGDAAASGPMTAAAVRKRVKAAEDAPLTESADVDAFFRPMTEEQDWHGPDEKETVARFRALVQALKDSLTDLRVFRVGEIDIDAYVVGRAKDGDYAGVKTHLVET